MARLVIGTNKTATASAVVRDKSPAHYIDKAVDANGKMIQGSNLINFNGVDDLDKEVLQYAYKGNTNITGNLDLSSLTKNTGESSLNCTFMNCTGITSVDLGSLTTVSGKNAFGSTFDGCTGITSVDLGSLTTIGSGEGGCRWMFKSCTHLTSIDLSSLVKVNAQAGCYSMFEGCTGITSVDLSNLSNVTGNYSLQYMFKGCTSITSADLRNVKMLKYTSCAQNMFEGCTSLVSVDLSTLQAIGGYYGCQNMFKGCTSLTSINLNKLLTIYDTSQTQSFGSSFENDTNLQSVDLSSLVFVSKRGLEYAFSGCTSLTSVSFPKLCKLGDNALQYTFRNCTSLTSVSFPNLAYTGTNINSAFLNMLQGCSNVTVHFPAEWENTMSTWSNITNGMGGTNTTVLFDLPSVSSLDLSYITDLYVYGVLQEISYQNYFPNITSVNLSNLRTISADTVLRYFFYYSSNLTSVDLSSLTSITNGYHAFECAFSNTNLTTVNLSSLTSITGLTSSCQSMFANNPNLTTADLSSLTTVSGNGHFSYMFVNDSNLTSINLSSLSILNGRLGDDFVRGSGVTSLSFPALHTVTDSYVFTNIFKNQSNGTLHFPSNMASYNFRDTYASSVLYDLPATNTLTGADTNIYSRNPKYDTATALAWKVGEYGTTNFTPAYYTSGTTDPVVGTTIYSDAACTTSVTTVSTIE